MEGYLNFKVVGYLVNFEKRFQSNFIFLFKVNALASLSIALMSDS